MAKDAPGMKGIRSRNENGRLRQKRSDTHVGTIEQEYKVDFGVDPIWSWERFLRRMVPNH